MKKKTKSKITVKAKLFAHFETMRLYTVTWCGLIGLVGSCIVYKGLPPINIAILAFIIPMMGWIAALYLSDYLDRKLDLIEKPHRPIPSGRIKPNEALAIGGLFAVSGFLLSFLLSLNNVILVFITASLVFLYTKISKSRGIIGNFNRGIVIIAAFFFGVFSKEDPVFTIPVYIILLSLVFFLHDTNSNLVGSIRDIEGDKKGGYITFPVKYGIKKSMQLSIILSIIYISLIIFITLYYDFLNYLYRFYLLFLVGIIVLIIMYITMFRNINKMDRKKALMAHEFFIAERVILASAFILGMINQILISTAIFIALLTITLSSQFFIRKRYEFEMIK